MPPGLRRPGLLTALRKRSALRWLLVLLLSAELLTALHHRHAVTAAMPDCAACAVAAQMSGGVPQAAPAAMAMPVGITFRLAPWSDPVPRTALAAHTLPFSQAPPPLS